MSGIVLDFTQPEGTSTTATRRQEQDVFLDKRQSAEIVMGDHPLDYLDIIFFPINASYPMGIQTGEGSVTLSGTLAVGTKVFVNGTEIATVSVLSGNQIRFTFTDEATAGLVKELIGAITFKDTGSSGFKGNDTCNIALVDRSGAKARSSIQIGEAVTGTDDPDTFTATSSMIGPGDELDGGAGDDLLELTDGGDFELWRMDKLTGIETIQGSDAKDYFYMDASQWSGLERIDGKGGLDTLILHGSYSDLSETEILNFEEIQLERGGKAKVADMDIAQLVYGTPGAGNELVIESGVLTATERLALHRHGIDKITTLEDGQTTSYYPPLLAHFGGTVHAPAGETVFMDRKRDAVLSVDAGAVRSLTLRIDNTDGQDTLGVAGLDDPTLPNGLSLTNGLNDESKLVMSVTSIDGTVYKFVVGKVLYAGHGVGDNIVTLGFEFNENATTSMVQEVIRSLTYKGSANVQQDRTVVIALRDVHENEIERTVTFSSDDIHANKLPTDIALSGVSVAENSPASTVIGTLSATDGDGDLLTYALSDDAGGRFEIRDGKLIVKDRTKIDFEKASSHKITVVVSDGEANVSQDFVIHVRDVLEVVPGATKGKNTLKGGSGADRINGGSGNDKLTGNAGADQFVFNTALGKGTTKANQNKKVNFDTITDFKRGEDKILLDNAIFKKLGKGSLASPGALNKNFFKKNKATDKNDYLIYKNGVVYYDADGSGTKYKPIEFIKLSNKPALSAADFLII